MDEMQQDEKADGRMAQRLLRGGVGLRHVRRTLRELRDHRADLVSRLMAQGHDCESAINEARIELGDRELLVQRMLERPDLRSRARRFAWLWFLFGPLVMICALGLAFIFALGATFEGGPGPGFLPSGVVELVIARVLLLWVTPLLVGLLLCRAAVRHWIPAVWPVCAIAIVAITAGFSHVFGDTRVENINFGWPPPELGRAAMLCALLALAYLWMRSTQSRSGGYA